MKQREAFKLLIVFSGSQKDVLICPWTALNHDFLSTADVLATSEYGRLLFFEDKIYQIESDFAGPNGSW